MTMCSGIFAGRFAAAVIDILAFSLLRSLGGGHMALKCDGYTAKATETGA